MIRPTDADIAELLLLQQQVKAMTKRIDEIKKACKKAGSFFTAQYTVSVISQSRVGLAGLEEVKEYIHEDILNKYGLIRKSEFLIVKIGQLPDVHINIMDEMMKPAST